MRIGELSARTGVPTPTIKYYVREGLLSGGERISHNQVSYGEEHVRRLRLVRALIEIGSLPIATVRQVLTEVDTPGRDLDGTLGVVSNALSKARETHGDIRPDHAGEALELAERHGWKAISAENHHIGALAEIIGTLRLLGQDILVDRIDDYARAARIVAETDIELLATLSDRDEILESMIVGTVLGDALFAALRRIVHVELSSRRFKGPEDEREEDSDS